MIDILLISGFVILGALLLYWFWPAPALCETCQSVLDDFCYCTNEECFYHTRMRVTSD